MPRQPPCPFFGRCGGCSLQDRTVQEQRLLKQQELSRIFSRDVVVHPAPSEFGYRSRMDFVCVPGMIGLRSAGDSRRVVDISSCLLLSEDADAAFGRVRDGLLASGLSSFDGKAGFLRYVTLRDTGSARMLVVTTSVPAPGEEKTFRPLLEVFSQDFGSVCWMVNDSRKDDAAIGELRMVIGASTIDAELLGKRFSLGPKTFFQSNITVAQTMFSRIRDAVSGDVLDLYCGVGAIALSVADRARSVLGVEEYAPSIDAARENAVRNGVAAAFEVGDAAEYLRFMVVEKRVFGTVIVDPPRAGLGVTAARALRRLAPEKVVYMSCNPRSLRDDLQALLPAYEVVSLEAFEMFPNTDHVECLAVLERE